jgi:hypothetical protein
VQTRCRPDGSVLISKAQRLHLHRFTSAAPDSNRIGRWQTEMTAAEREEFEAVASPLLRELGYETGS